jgi:hypothetical protein
MFAALSALCVADISHRLEVTGKFIQTVFLHCFLYVEKVMIFVPGCSPTGRKKVGGE